MKGRQNLPFSFSRYFQTKFPESAAARRHLNADYSVMRTMNKVRFHEPFAKLVRLSRVSVDEMPDEGSWGVRGE